MKINLEDFNNIDFNNVGNWPIAVKGVALIILFVAVLGAAYYFDTQHQLVEIERLQAKEIELRKDFEGKQWQASTLPQLKEQLAEIELNLQDVQKRLPNQAEVARLIQEISQAVIASGLQATLFEPGSDQREDYIMKRPIKLSFIGDYHSFGKFVSTIASLPRIVTQHEVNISRFDNNRLIMTMTAQIYRYVEEG